MSVSSKVRRTKDRAWKRAHPTPTRVQIASKVINEAATLQAAEWHARRRVMDQAVSSIEAAFRQSVARHRERVRHRHRVLALVVALLLALFVLVLLMGG